MVHTGRGLGSVITGFTSGAVITGFSSVQAQLSQALVQFRRSYHRL
jgi:hypothetical protein